MADSLSNQLDVAVARGSAAVISLPSDGMFRNYRTRFLGMSPEGLWVDNVPGESPLITQLIRTSESCPVTFKSSGTPVQFKSRVLMDDPEHVVNGGLNVSALLLERPDEVAPVQQRESYRVKIADSKEWTVQAWRLSETADLAVEPGPNTQIDLSIVDLSITGMGAIHRAKPGQPPLATPQRLRLILTWRGDTTLLEGKAMSVRLTDDGKSAIVGVRFEGLQSALNGRKIDAKLTRIVGELGRAELQKLKNLV